MKEDKIDFYVDLNENDNREEIQQQLQAMVGRYSLVWCVDYQLFVYKYNDKIKPLLQDKMY